MPRPRIPHVPLNRLLKGLTGQSRKYSTPSLPGDYSVILPKEPFVWGVSHIIPRLVPPQIKRPAYAQIDADGTRGSDSYTGDGRITLGSPEEALLRNSASLAKDVLNFAGQLVKVYPQFTICK